ncbi:GldG family protein [Rhodovibrio salinarum]|uniref:GldG family protein n=1 Tax=Rhodovibrio salinarum TaxID=1087 RepID=UPI00047F2076|nr:GldG family protein [Rhodovibrio salinarum]
MFSRRTRSRLTLPLAVLCFLAVNAFALQALDTARLDLTADSRHTLSQTTRRVLADIPEPITLSYYRSEAVRTAGPPLADYARRVSAMLDRYVRLSDGKLRLQRFTPAPYSPEEDRALADGLTALQLGRDGETAYFGLVGRNSTDDRETIPLFAPERAAFLEHDLTRAIRRLAHPQAPRVGLLTGLPMTGDPAAGTPDWRILERLRQDYEVVKIDSDDTKLPEALNLLILAQPSGLDDELATAIRRYAEQGSAVLAFADPFAETLALASAPGTPYGDGLQTLAPLLHDWGVAIDPDMVVGDRAHARRVRARVGGRETAVDYLPWLLLPGARLSADDPATANLPGLALNSAGRLRALDGTHLTPLATSGDQSADIAIGRLATRPNPGRLLADFAPDGEPRVLAARVQRPEGSGALVVVADSDLLDDAVWTRRQEVMGEQRRVAATGNGDFVLNLVDTLTGGQALLGLRGRGLSDRPFTVIEQIRRQAEAQYRAREQQLAERVDQARTRIAALQRREQETGVVLSDDQQAEIERLRADMLDARGELRDVQHQLRAGVARIESRVQALVTWTVPALVALAALALALLRRWRRARTPAARG